MPTKTTVAGITEAMTKDVGKVTGSGVGVSVGSGVIDEYPMAKFIESTTKGYFLPTA